MLAKEQIEVLEKLAKQINEFIDLQYDAADENLKVALDTIRNKVNESFHSRIELRIKQAAESQSYFSEAERPSFNAILVDEISTYSELLKNHLPTYSRFNKLIDNFLDNYFGYRLKLLKQLSQIYVERFEEVWKEIEDLKGAGNNFLAQYIDENQEIDLNKEDAFSTEAAEDEELPTVKPLMQSFLARLFYEKFGSNIPQEAMSINKATDDYTILSWGYGLYLWLAQNFGGIADINKTPYLLSNDIYSKFLDSEEYKTRQDIAQKYKKLVRINKKLNYLLNYSVDSLSSVDSNLTTLKKMLDDAVNLYQIAEDENDYNHLDEKAIQLLSTFIQMEERHDSLAKSHELIAKYFEVEDENNLDINFVLENTSKKELARIFNGFVGKGDNKKFIEFALLAIKNITSNENSFEERINAANKALEVNEKYLSYGKVKNRDGKIFKNISIKLKGEIRELISFDIFKVLGEIDSLWNKNPYENSDEIFTLCNSLLEKLKHFADYLATNDTVMSEAEYNLFELCKSFVSNIIQSFDVSFTSKTIKSDEKVIFWQDYLIREFSAINARLNTLFPLPIDQSEIIVLDKYEIALEIRNKFNYFANPEIFRNETFDNVDTLTEAADCMSAHFLASNEQKDVNTRKQQVLTDISRGVSINGKNVTEEDENKKSDDIFSELSSEQDILLYIKQFLSQQYINDLGANFVLTKLENLGILTDDFSLNYRITNIGYVKEISKINDNLLSVNINASLRNMMESIEACSIKTDFSLVKNSFSKKFDEKLKDRSAQNFEFVDIRLERFSCVVIEDKLKDYYLKIAVDKAINEIFLAKTINANDLRALQLFISPFVKIIDSKRELNIEKFNNYIQNKIKENDLNSAIKLIFILSWYSVAFAKEILSISFIKERMPDFCLAALYHSHQEKNYFLSILASLKTSVKSNGPLEKKNTEELFLMALFDSEIFKTLATNHAIKLKFMADRKGIYQLAQLMENYKNKLDISLPENLWFKNIINEVSEIKGFIKTLKNNNAGSVVPVDVENYCASVIVNPNLYHYFVNNFDWNIFIAGMFRPLITVINEVITGKNQLENQKYVYLLVLRYLNPDKSLRIQKQWENDKYTVEQASSDMLLLLAWMSSGNAKFILSNKALVQKIPLGYLSHIYRKYENDESIRETLKNLKFKVDLYEVSLNQVTSDNLSSSVNIIRELNKNSFPSLFENQSVTNAAIKLRNEIATLYYSNKQLLSENDKKTVREFNSNFIKTVYKQKISLVDLFTNHFESLSGDNTGLAYNIIYDSLQHASRDKELVNLIKLFSEKLKDNNPDKAKINKFKKAFETVLKYDAKDSEVIKQAGHEHPGKFIVESILKDHNIVEKLNSKDITALVKYHPDLAISLIPQKGFKTAWKKFWGTIPDLSSKFKTSAELKEFILAFLNPLEIMEALFRPSYFGMDYFKLLNSNDLIEILADAKCSDISKLPLDQKTNLLNKLLDTTNENHSNILAKKQTAIFKNIRCILDTNLFDKLLEKTTDNDAIVNAYGIAKKVLAGDVILNELPEPQVKVYLDEMSLHNADIKRFNEAILLPQVVEGQGLLAEKIKQDVIRAAERLSTPSTPVETNENSTAQKNKSDTTGLIQAVVVQKQRLVSFK